MIAVAISIKTIHFYAIDVFLIVVTINNATKFDDVKK